MNPVGYTAHYHAGNDLHFRVRILKMRMRAGRLYYTITPIEGTGQATVLADRIILEEPEPAYAT